MIPLAGDLNFDMKIDAKALNFFQRQAPQKLKLARKNAVEAMGMVWADEAKSITRNENHIDTSLYINSIGYSTGSPANPLYDLSEANDKTRLMIGADVSYASALEKRYAIMARALDLAGPRMQSVAKTQIHNTLFS